MSLAEEYERLVQERLGRRTTVLFWMVVVIMLGLFLMLQCWRWSRPEPAPLRASPTAAEPEPVAQAEIGPYPNR